MRSVRRTPVFHRVVPVETGIGWPIPLLRGAEVHLRLPLLPTVRAATGGALLFPPFATITVDPFGRVVDLDEPALTREAVGRFPHDAVRGTLEEYRLARERLLTGYDELTDAMRDHRAFEAEADFAHLLGLLVEPALLPYYRSLGEAFFARFLGPGPIAGRRPGPAAGRRAGPAAS